MAEQNHIEVEVDQGKVAPLFYEPALMNFEDNLTQNWGRFNVWGLFGGMPKKNIHTQPIITTG
ncbi:MAG: hypothetical protein WCW53_11895 [Syntrophales bacterium]|jgi:hypothetical protein